MTDEFLSQIEREVTVILDVIAPLHRARYHVGPQTVIGGQCSKEDKEASKEVVEKESV